VSTEVDARLFVLITEGTIKQARSIIVQYDAAGIGRNRILVKIASTWEGISRGGGSGEGRHPLQPDAAVRTAPSDCGGRCGRDAGSPFVGRILDWYKKDTGKDFHGADDPGVQSVDQGLQYYKKFGYKTQVMGASFRNIGEITELAGSDLLTISPQLLAELEATQANCRASSIRRRRKSFPSRRSLWTRLRSRRCMRRTAWLRIS